VKRIGCAILFCLWCSSALYADKTDPATKGDIELLIHQIDKRFEQVDKRFEQMDKRFDHLLWFIGILTTLSTCAIGYIVTRLSRQEAKEPDVAALAIALRKADPAVKKLLREALR
jgi:hypothetical protein